MNFALKAIFLFYQGLFPSSVRSCRFTPTCSEYCLNSIEKKGILIGIFLTTKRLFSCHPFTKRPHYDPI